MSICQSVITDGRNKLQGIKESFLCQQDQQKRDIFYLFTVQDAPLQEICQNPSKESVLPTVSFWELLKF